MMTSSTDITVSHRALVDEVVCQCAGVWPNNLRSSEVWTRIQHLEVADQRLLLLAALDWEGRSNLSLRDMNSPEQQSLHKAIYEVETLIAELLRRDLGLQCQDVILLLDWQLYQNAN